ncbi:MAG TPA: sugar phosphate isomerase/epimerase family protein [Bryobacteraceae bacterium]|jgi:D-psicose/D-tagatose/L-ribulose 3-epimerase|nr:sugar phosphate isomerase/epimerase family protein [Bryobacteraceae bacterium]
MRKANVSRRGALAALGGAAAAALAGNSGVLIGVCGPPQNFGKAAQFGFDYYEPGAAAVAAMSETDFVAFRDRVLASKIRCRSLNSLIRSGHVVGPEADLEAACRYLETTLERCRELGAAVAVWGSASSRNVPEGFSRDEAWRQMKMFLNRAGDIAQSKQITIAIEPLRKQESNILNTGAEALRLVREVNHPRVQMIIDYYHLRAENEDPEIVRAAREHIVHMHFANPEGRRWPRDASEDPMYARFFRIVKEVNYRGGISIEGNGAFESDGAASLAFFRSELA